MSWRKRWFVHAERKATERRQTAETKRALVDWLSRARWHVFYTQTFRKEVSAVAARTLFSSGLAELFSSWGVMAACWSVEPHTTRRSHHVHSLLAVSSPRSWGKSKTPLTSLTANSWRSRNGHNNTTNKCIQLKEWGWKRFGIARPFPITTDQRTMTVAYVVKYLMKKVNPDVMTGWTDEECERMNQDKLWGIDVSDVRFMPEDPPAGRWFTIDDDRPPA